MKTIFRSLIVACLCGFALSVAGQTPAATPPAGTGKIGIVNPILFTDEKGPGLTRLKAVLKTLNDELKPLADKLQSDRIRYRSVVAEVDKMRNTPNTNTATFQAKVNEGQDLETSIKRTEEDYKDRYDKRYPQLVGPVFDDIFRAMNEYAKQKGYAIILNGPKLEQDDILMGFDDRYDVTADFITFYNARPAARQ